MSMEERKRTAANQGVLPRARGRAPRLSWHTAGVLVTLFGCDAGASDAAGAEVLDASAADAARADAAPRLSELVQTLFAPGCVLGRCHTTAAPAGELSFTGRRLSVHEALVNAASSERPDRMRVVPFDPDASYLMEKISSESPSVGTRMPPMGALPASEIERVRAWIAAGALDD
jgi:hypothetical protein